jgi:hypothetical protein
MLYELLLVLVLSAFLMANSTQRCSEGPYYFERFTDIPGHRAVEGLGQTSWHLTSGFGISQVLNLKYIMNPQPMHFRSEDYSELFYFDIESENSHCSAVDVISHPDYENIEFTHSAKHHVRANRSHIIHLDMHGSSLRYEVMSNCICPYLRGDTADLKSTLRQLSHLLEYNFNKFSDDHHSTNTHKSTIFILHLDYMNQFDYFKDACLSYKIFTDMYTKRKEYDIAVGKPRTVVEKDLFVIMYHIRWGDQVTQNPYDNLYKLQENAVYFLKMLLGHKESVLEGYDKYKIYIMTELSMTFGGVIFGNVSDFDTLMAPFPKNSIELRVDSSALFQDVDLVSIADVFIFERPSTFSGFLINSVLKDSGTGFSTVQHTYYNHEKELDYNDFIKHQNFSAFNKRVCALEHMDLLQTKCSMRGITS